MAAKLQCEICGGKLIGRPGGVFECDSCGMEYDTAWAKAKIQEITGTVKVEGTVEVTGKVQVDGPVKVEGGVNKEALLQRGRLALEDGEWNKAKEVFEQALSLDAEYADAWLGIAMAELQLCSESGFSGLSDGQAAVADNANYQKFLRFASPERSREIVARMDAAEKKAENLKNADAAARAAFREKLPALRARIAPAQGMIAAGKEHVLGLKADGTVIASGENAHWEYDYKGERVRKKDGRCDVADWSDIVALAAAGEFSVGLKSDGSLVIAGFKDRVVCVWKDVRTGKKSEVTDWRDVVAIAAYDTHIVGLKSDGTVVAVRDENSEDYAQCNITTWENIAAISTCRYHTVGLKTNGTVTAIGQDGKYLDSRKTKLLNNGRCKVRDWEDVVSIAAGIKHTVGLKADGSVITTEDYEQRDKVSAWREIVEIYALDNITIGLKANGTVVCTWDEPASPLSVVADWKDVVAISASDGCVFGLRADGTVLSVSYGMFMTQEIDVSGWKLFDSIDTLKAERQAAEEKRREAAEKAEAERRAAEEKAEAERKAAAEKAEAERKAKIAKLEAEQAALSSELANLKGLFTGKRRKEIEVRLDDIASEIYALS